MAKAKRNLVALRRDNRTDRLPIICSYKGCEDEALRIRGPHEKRIKECAAHVFNPPQNTNELFLKSLGLV